VEQRTYRGPITARGLAQALVMRFNAGHLTAQSAGTDDQMIVQIAARERDWGSDTRPVLTITIVQHEEAVDVTIGEQQWLGPAADLLQAGVKGWLNPLSLIGELSEIAEDIQTLQLPQQVWETVDQYARSAGARLGLAEEDRLVACPFCGIGNPVGAGQCKACGGSLVSVQPKACPKCGQLSPPTAVFCNRCGAHLGSTQSA
jgi:ribosomal protein L40E